MKILSIAALPVAVTKEDGVVDKVVILPGMWDYKIDHKDPQVAEQLRVYRKHGKITFEELLPSDVELLKGIKGSTNDKFAELRRMTTRQPSPAKREVKGVKNVKRSPKAKRVRTGVEPETD